MPAVARLTTPTLKAIWQIIVRDNTVNPTARGRMMKALEDADRTAAITADKVKAETALATLTGQLQRIRAVMFEVLPTLDPNTSDPELLTLVEQSLATARQTRQVEREKLVEIGRFEDGHTTHALVMRALEDLHDRPDESAAEAAAGDDGPAAAEPAAAAGGSAGATRKRTAK